MNNFDKTQIGELLGYFDSSNRDEWVDVFRALGNAFPNDTEVFKQCVSWASSSKKHDTKAIKHERDLFYKDNKGIGLGVLIKKAQEKGFQLRQRVIASNTSKGDVGVKLESSDATETSLYSDILNLSSVIISNLIMYCTAEDRSNFISKYKNSLNKAPDDHVGIYNALYQHTKTHSTFVLQEFKNTLRKYKVPDELFNSVSSKASPLTLEALCEQMETMIDKASCLQVINISKANIKAALEGRKDEIKRLTNQAMICLGSNVGLKSLKEREEVLESCNSALNDISDPNVFNHLYISTGYKALDNQIYGYRRGEVSILAAHTGVGKTYFGIETALRAIENNKRVLFFTAEMSVDSIAQRLFMVKMKTTEKIIKEHGFPQKAFKEFSSSYDLKSNLKIIGGRSMTINDIKSSVDSAKFIGDVDLIVIDYLQIIENDRLKRGEQWELISDVMHQLVALAQDSDTAILVLTQLTKPQYEKTKRGSPSKKKEPTLYDIAGSSGVVRDVALALILYREDEEGGAFNMVVAKSRYASSSQRFVFNRTTGGGFNLVEKGYSMAHTSDVTRVNASIMPTGNDLNQYTPRGKNYEIAPGVKEVSLDEMNMESFSLFEEGEL